MTRLRSVIGVAAAAAVLALISARRKRKSRPIEYSVWHRAPDPKLGTKDVYLVTGGTGTLGARLISELRVAKPSARIVVVDIASPAPDRRRPGVTYIIGDSTEPEHLRWAIREAVAGDLSLLCIFHQAGRLPDCATTYDNLDQINGHGTMKLVSTCVEMGVPRLVYTSSASVVVDVSRFDGEGNMCGDVGESLPYTQPALLGDDYAYSKQVGEIAVLQANGRQSADKPLMTCAIRPSIIFDGRDRKLIQDLVCGKGNVVFDSGEHISDMVWAVDVAKAHVAAAEALVERPADVAGKAFHVGGGGLSWKEFLDARDVSDSSKTIWGREPPRSVPFSLVLCLARINIFIYRLLGVAPIDFYLRPDSLCYLAPSNSWWFDCAEAKRVLKYQITPVREAAAAILKERDELRGQGIS